MHGTRDQPAHIIQFERREHDLVHPRPSPAQRIQRQHERVRRADFVVAIGSDQQQVACLTPANQVLDESKGRGVDPLQVVEKQHQRVLGLGEHLEERAKHHLKAVARVLRWQVRDRRLFADHELQLRNETRDELAVRLHGLPDGIAPASEFRFVAAKNHQHEGLQCPGERGVRDVARQLIALSRSEDSPRQAQCLLQLVDDR